MIVAWTRRLAESQRAVLPINLFDPPIETPEIEISLAKARILTDPGALWLPEQVLASFSNLSRLSIFVIKRFLMVQPGESRRSLKPSLDDSITF